MRACGIEDEKFIKQAKLRLQLKLDQRERGIYQPLSKRDLRDLQRWLAQRPLMLRTRGAGQAKYQCFGCLSKLGISKQEVMWRLKIGSSVYTSWSYRMRQSQKKPTPILVTEDNYHLVFPDNTERQNERKNGG